MISEDLKMEKIQDQIDNFETHIVPIIADIDAGLEMKKLFVNKEND
jgi:isocitrate lyase